MNKKKLTGKVLPERLIIASRSKLKKLNLSPRMLNFNKINKKLSDFIKK